MAETEQPGQAVDRRYPTSRPRWLGPFQPWPCGRCGKDVEEDEKHDCPDPAPEATPDV